MKAIFKAFILFYKNVISPVLPKTCRFQPTCSTYALEAIEAHGVLKGVWLAAKRISKCHPLYKGRIFDPVPPVHRKETGD